MPDGLVDTSVFLHAQTHDVHAEECVRFLEAVRQGRVHVRLEPLVLHELSYALPRYRRQMTRAQVAHYLLTIVGWQGFVCDTTVLTGAVERWRDTPGLAFVDAYLSAIAARDGCPVYTKYVGELERQGVLAPNPLPS